VNRIRGTYPSCNRENRGKVKAYLLLTQGVEKERATSPQGLPDRFTPRKRRTARLE